MKESFLPGDKTDLPVLVTRYLLAGLEMRRGRFGKIHLTDTRRLLWSPGASLSPTGTGRQLRARAKDEPGISVFLLSTNTSRLEYPNGNTFRDNKREKEGERQNVRKRFIFRHWHLALLSGLT